MRFCTSCQSKKTEEGGEDRKLRRTRRWICADCLACRSESIYKSRGLTPPEKVSRLMAAVYGRHR